MDATIFPAQAMHLKNVLDTAGLVLGMGRQNIAHIQLPVPQTNTTTAASSACGGLFGFKGSRYQQYRRIALLQACGVHCFRQAKIDANVSCCHSCAGCERLPLDATVGDWSCGLDQGVRNDRVRCRFQAGRDSSSRADTWPSN